MNWNCSSGGIMCLNQKYRHSLEDLVGEIVHFLSKQMLGSIGEDMMEVTPWPTPSMAQEVAPVHTAEPGSRIIRSVWDHLFFWKFMLWLVLEKEEANNNKKLQNLHCIKGSRFHVAERHIFLLQHFLNLSCMRQWKVWKRRYFTFIHTNSNTQRVVTVPEVMTQSTSRVSALFM